MTMQEDTAVEGVAVRADVRLDHSSPEERRIRALDRNVDARERGDRLRRAALETWKSSFVRSVTNAPFASVTTASIST